MTQISLKQTIFKDKKILYLLNKQHIPNRFKPGKIEKNNKTPLSTGTNLKERRDQQTAREVKEAESKYNDQSENVYKREGESTNTPAFGHL